RVGNGAGPAVRCPPLVEDGGSGFMTFEIGVPSPASDHPYQFVVPGVEGEAIEAVVPCRVGGAAARAAGGAIAVCGRPCRRRFAAAAAVLALVAVLASCADEAPQDTWQPEGDNAQKIHHPQWTVVALARVVGLIVM